ncbi:MAG: hypothetical protein EBX50_21345 [Chitinophagia bacterium]|nr:hypothetical protein [Chitinophagia bacterium]
MKINDRLNQRMANYIKAVNGKADPEVIHYELRDLIAEAIKVDISLKELLKVLSSYINKGNDQNFIDNVAKHYSREEDQEKK